jgi:hypothetical protein
MNNEITISSEQDLHKNWPFVTYKGNDFFDKFCEALEFVDPNNISNRWVSSSQEVYIGYLKDSDEFIVGWDIWTDELFGSLIVICSFDGNNIDVISHEDFDYGFYGSKKDNAHDTIKEIYQNLIDLRLD